MAGKRYFAAGGIRDRAEAEGFPFAVIFGPSGQAVQVPYPKGYVDDNQFTPALNERIPTTTTQDGSNVFGAGFAEGLAGYEHTFSHVQVEWFKNHLLNSFIDGATQGRCIGYAFQPYRQPVSGFFRYPSGVNLLTDGAGNPIAGFGQPRINSFPDLGGNGNFNPTQNTELIQQVVMDGFYWMMPFYFNPTSFRHLFGFRRIPGGFFYARKVPEAETYLYGLWEAKFPHIGFFSELYSGEFDAQAGSGFRGLDQNLTTPNHTFDPRYTAGMGTVPGGVDQYFGVKMGGNQNMTGLGTNVIDIEVHKGNVWVATQYSLMCVTPGGRMQVINDERCQDLFAGGITTRTEPSEIEDYQSRQQQNSFGGPLSRSLASHQGELYMLTNAGKLFICRPGGLRELADLTELGTFSSSGVFGGSMNDMPTSIESWGGSSAYRCKLVSFNGELHAFLNFRSNFNVAKHDNPDNPGFGRGVLWATSQDAVNWTDFSTSLPASGIVKPSGNQGDWELQIAPYRFSGTPGRVFPSGELGDGNNTLDYPDPAGMAGPSGFHQEGVLDFWASGVGAIDTFGNSVGTSGVILDDEGTSYDQLRVPLTRGRTIRYLYPTSVINPAGFGFINAASGRVAGVPLASGSGGVYEPSGVGASGLDYTGCRNYHVSAFVDEVNNTLKVSFSEDYNDGGALVYELNSSSGWRLINHVRDSKQLNGLVPIDMYDPEIVIPSGTQTRPNPSHDPVNKTMTIDYEVYDWPFWRTVDIEVEYSIDDGLNWKRIGTIEGVSTGSQATDPSGVQGNSGTFVWEYSDHTRTFPLSPSMFYPSVQVRMRGKDTNFTNPV